MMQNERIAPLLHPAMFLYFGQGTVLGAWCQWRVGMEWDIKTHRP